MPENRTDFCEQSCALGLQFLRQEKWIESTHKPLISQGLQRAAFWQQVWTVFQEEVGKAEDTHCLFVY